jgi:hypothetical protein
MVTRLDGEETSKQRPPYKTSATVKISLRIDRLSQTMGTHPRDLLKVITRTNPQHLDRNLVIFVLAFPDISIPTLIQWIIRPVVMKLDFYGSWE